MKIESFAPGKIILFGEHTVVYNKPAIAVAINRGVDVELTSRDDDEVNIHISPINYSQKLVLTDGMLNYEYDSSNKRISDYIYEVINRFKFNHGFNLNVNINMYLGAGLGSSAAVTVAVLKAVMLYTDNDATLDEIASIARDIEIKIQGAASPIDTAMSTYGGIIYIDENSNLNPINFDMQLPLIVSNCEIAGNTGEIVASVKDKYDKHTPIMESIFDAMAKIATDAKIALECGNSMKLAELMNMNQGLLDAIGVNTLELSEMVYQSRKFGSEGSKLTGSGGGGCIIAYAPHDSDEVYLKLSQLYKTFKCKQSNSGVYAKIVEK